MSASSLSAVLPVHNAQSRIAALVSGLLDILPELTRHWDILVIDDASADATCEAAHELERSYPQVRLVSHPTRLGFDECLRTSLGRVRGDALLIRDEDCEIGPHEVHRLWRARQGCDVVSARPVLRTPLGWLPRLPGMSNDEDDAPRPTWRLIERRFVEGWRVAGNGRTLEQYLERHGAVRREIDVQLSKAASVWAPVRGRRRRAALPARLSGAAAPSVRRPNYLDKLRQFALGE